MAVGFIKKQIIKSTWQSILGWVLVLVVVTFLVYYGVLSRQISSLYQSPPVVHRLDEIEAGKIVKLSSKLLGDAGYDRFEDNKKDGVYAFTQLDDGSWVLILLRNKDEDLLKKNRATVTGMVSELKTYEKEIVAELKDWQAESVEQSTAQPTTEVWAKYKITNGTNYYLVMVIGWLGVAGIVFILYKIGQRLAIVVDYQRSPIYQQLQSQGERSLIERKIEAEIQAEKSFKLSKRSYLTDSAVLIFNGSEGLIRPRSELKWIYKNETRHYTNGIPSGKTYGLKFVFKDKTVKEISYRNQKETDAILAQLIELYPADFDYGFDQDKNKKYLTK